MAKVAIVRMWLYVAAQDPAVQDALDQRYSRELEERWKRMTFIDLAHLHTQLNSELQSGVLGVIQALDQANATTCSAFPDFGAPSGWTVGSSGQHEDDAYVSVEPTVGSGLWEFTVDQATHQIHVGLHWSTYTTP